MHAEFDDIAHLVVEQLNIALLSTWVLHTFYSGGFQPVAPLQGFQPVAPRQGFQPVLGIVGLLLTSLTSPARIICKEILELL